MERGGGEGREEVEPGREGRGGEGREGEGKEREGREREKEREK